MVNPHPHGHSRVIALDFDGPAPDHRAVPTADEHRRLVSRIAGHEVDLDRTMAVTRFSDYARTVRTMGDGPLILVGDAAHVHYPLGGQGLNTGLQDAFGLAWRLARLTSPDPAHGPELLEEYSRHRVSMAQAVVANTVLQSRAMNPHHHLGDAVEEMLRTASIHDAIADVISGEHQPGFVPDIPIRRTGESSTLSTAIRRHGHVVLTRENTSATNAYRPDPRNDTSHLRLPLEVTPDGYRTTSHDTDPPGG